MRERVYDIVYSVLEGGKKSDERFHDEIEGVDSERIASIKRLSYGTIEYAVMLGAIIEQYTQKPIQKLDSDVRICLLMAFYEILFADSIPGYATANEIVELASKKCIKNREKKKSYINANIRTFLRDIENGVDVFGKLNQNERLSMPIDLWNMLNSAYGKKTAAKVAGAFLEKKGEVTLHIDSSRISVSDYITKLESCTNGLSIEKGRYFDDAVIIRGATDIKSLPGYDAGEFYIQDESSMLPVTVSGIRSGDTVVDVCGAPGGKSVHALMRLAGTGFVSVRDVSDDKLARIKENLSRYPYENYECKVFDGRKVDEKWTEKADVVLLDVPCSGVGILRRKPELKYRCMENAKELIPIQRKIAAASVKMLKPGGVMIYSTCTINPDENDKNVDYLIESFCLIPESLDEYLPAGLTNSQTKTGRLLVLPGLMEMDGFFVARLRKPE